MNGDPIAAADNVAGGDGRRPGRGLMRAVLAAGAVGPVIEGHVAYPGWIFTLCTAGLYCGVTALYGRGLLTGVWGEAARLLAEEGDEATEFDLNVGRADRVARAAAAAGVLTAVIAGASSLQDAVYYFTLTLGGFYAAMTAIMAWDPLYGLLRLSTRRTPAAGAPPLPSLRQAVARVWPQRPPTHRHAA